VKSAVALPVARLMPGGVLVTLPLPLPVVRASSVWTRMAKVAVTVAAASRVRVQVLVPVQAPLQPVKVERWWGGVGGR
jgi:hypothetical protein